MDNNPTELAYFSGYIDGDGCFIIRKHQIGRGTKYQSSLVITSVNEDNIVWMIKKFGGSINRVKNQNINHRPLFRYYLSGKDTEKLNLSPYLVQRKQEFEIFKNFRNSFSHKTRDNFIKEMETEKFSNLVINSIKHEVESIRNTIIPIEEDFAYLAGFIDAECSLGIQKDFPKNRPNPIYKIRLQLNDSKSSCFYWLSQRFGGQFHFFDRSNSKKLQNQMAWRLTSKSLFQILPKILPYLIHKQSVCKKLIEFYETTLPNGGARHTETFRDSYDSILIKREEIFHIVQSLNKKGI